jgi:hypothetical protein
MPRDREYKEQFENQDLQELDRKVEHALVPKEGEEPIDEEVRNHKAKKLRLELLTKAFYYPPEKLEKEKKKKKEAPVV